MLTICEMLFRQLNNLKIRYLLWKGNNHYHDGICGIGDVDILIHAEDAGKARSVLTDLQFINPATQSYTAHPAIEDWLGFDAESGKMVHIHFHTAMVLGYKYTNEYEFTPYELCFDKAIQRENIALQHPVLEYFLLLCRIAFGNLNNKKKVEENLIYLRQHIAIEDLTAIAVTCGIDETTAHRLHHILSSHSSELVSKKVKNELAVAVRSLVKKTVSAPSFKNHLRRYQATYRHSRSKKNLRFTTKKSLKGNGLMIAFIGQDGAGKSTVTHLINEWLSWKLNARRLYLGSGDHYMSWQKKLLRKLSKKKAGLPINILRGLLSISNHLKIAKKTYKTLKAAKKMAERGGIALFDRYPQLAHNGINDGPKIRHSFSNNLGNSIMRFFILRGAAREETLLKKAIQYTPDIVIKLMLSPEESIRRKPEENLELVRRKHEIIKGLFFEGAQTYTINATMSFEEEIRTIKSIIWKNLCL